MFDRTIVSDEKLQEIRKGLTDEVYELLKTYFGRQYPVEIATKVILKDAEFIEALAKRLNNLQLKGGGGG